MIGFEQLLELLRRPGWAWALWEYSARLGEVERRPEADRNLSHSASGIPKWVWMRRPQVPRLERVSKRSALRLGQNCHVFGGTADDSSAATPKAALNHQLRRPNKSHHSKVTAVRCSRLVAALMSFRSPLCTSTTHDLPLTVPIWSATVSENGAALECPCMRP